MFNNQRYITKGVIADIPPYLQNMMWYMIEIMPIQKDHLQIFELSIDTASGKPKQRILHKQEQPEYLNEHVFDAATPVKAKVYVIDDGSHCTMLLSEEY